MQAVASTSGAQAPRRAPSGGAHDLTSPGGARSASRSGALDGPTSGLAPGFVQGNLAILPADLAGDFLRFCQRNPKPCPLIGVSEAGDPRLPSLGEDLDIRTDIPRYRVWKDGVLIDEPQDIMRWWRGDLVAFVLGCSHSFEEALIEDGLAIRHIERGTTVPMYRTDIACTPAGPFEGPMVVSMRPFRPADAIRAIQITTRFPAVHGAPVHIGLPRSSASSDLGRPDFGEAVPIARGRVARLLGLRRHAPGRDPGREAAFRDHPCAGKDDRDRYSQQPARCALSFARARAMAARRRASQPCATAIGWPKLCIARKAKEVKGHEPQRNHPGRRLGRGRARRHGPSGATAGRGH